MLLVILKKELRIVYGHLILQETEAFPEQVCGLFTDLSQEQLWPDALPATTNGSYAIETHKLLIHKPCILTTEPRLPLRGELNILTTETGLLLVILIMGKTNFSSLQANTLNCEITTTRFGFLLLCL